MAEQMIVRCGTVGGYNRHLNNGQIPDELCAFAWHFRGRAQPALPTEPAAGRSCHGGEAADDDDDCRARAAGWLLSPQHWWLPVCSGHGARIVAEPALYGDVYLSDAALGWPA